VSICRKFVLKYEAIFSFCLIINLLFIVLEEFMMGNINFIAYDLGGINAQAQGNMAMEYFN
jgi:hypothetical protein